MSNTLADKQTNVWPLKLNCYKRMFELHNSHSPQIFWHTIKYHRIKYIGATDRCILYTLLDEIHQLTLSGHKLEISCRPLGVCFDSHLTASLSLSIFFITHKEKEWDTQVQRHHTMNVESAKDFNDINRFLLYIIFFFDLQKEKITKISAREDEKRVDTKPRFCTKKKAVDGCSHRIYIMHNASSENPIYLMQLFYFLNHCHHNVKQYAFDCEISKLADKTSDYFFFFI